MGFWELWLQFSPWGLKNSLGHYLFIRNFWSSVEREVGRKEIKGKESIRVVVGLILLLVSLFFSCILHALKK